MIRVLFVDDEEHVLDGLRKRFWRKREWEMVFAPSAAAALEHLALAPFDVIVSDMRMPVMDGALLLERVTRDWPATYRVILSGQADRDAFCRGRAFAHEWLNKPCDGAMLGEVVNRVVRERP